MIHHGLRDRLFGAPGVWSTRQCPKAGCRLAWLDPRPCDDQIGKLYENYFTHGSAEEIEALERGEAPPPVDLGPHVSRGRTRLAKRVLARIMPWRRLSFDSDFLFVGSGRPGRVLDVGCGAGDYLRVLRAAGWEAAGIDFDAAAVAMARRRGLDARVGDLVGRAFPDARFDAVTMNNVIEHLPDPAATFAECRRILRPGGRLVVMTPNVEAFGHAAYGPDWRGLEVPRHLFIHSAATLRRFARRAGFAHVEAFAEFRGQGGARFMIDQSETIAAASGRGHPRPDAAAMGRRSDLLAWLGLVRSEWVFLVAQA